MSKKQKGEKEGIGWKWSIVVFIGALILTFIVYPNMRELLDPNKYEGEDICIVSKNDEYFFVNFENKIVTPEKYDYIAGLNQKGYYRYLQDNKWGYLSGVLEVRMEAQYDDCGSFSNELAPVSKDNKWWYIDLFFNDKIEGPFDWAGEFYGGKAIVKKEKEFFIIDQDGKELDGPLYSCDRVYENGFLIRRTKEDKLTLLDQNLSEVKWKGRSISDPIFVTKTMTAMTYREGEQTKCRLIDLETDKVLLDNMDTIVISLDKKIICKKGKQWMFAYPQTGKFINFDAEEVAANSKNLYPIKKDGYWGAVNEKGNIVIEPAYEMIGPFEDGFASVKAEGKWGVIDENGEILLPCEYDFAEYTQ